VNFLVISNTIKTHLDFWFFFRTCDTFSCMPYCAVIAGLSLQTRVEMTPTSHCPGKIEIYNFFNKKAIFYRQEILRLPVD